MKPFFTKKQKNLMKVRRKKQKLALRGLEVARGGGDPVPSANIMIAADKAGATGAAGRRRALPEAEAAASEASKESGRGRLIQQSIELAAPSGFKKKRRRAESAEEAGPPPTSAASPEATPGAIGPKPIAATVLVPSGLSSKEAKKFRKDARRRARLEGRDVDFVDERDVQKQPKDGDDGHRTPPSKKRKEEQSKKRESLLPRINDLVRQAKDESEREKMARQARSEEEGLPEAYKKRYVALDCEMVGIGADGKTSALARVSIVDWEGRALLDTYVKVESRVVDFRTRYSGIKPRHIKDAEALSPADVREKVAEIVRGRVVVGHALQNDFGALMLHHPKELIRDTAKHRPFQRLHNGKWRPRKLRDLVLEHLGKTIQEGSHDSVTDAASAMELFRVARGEWERELDERAKKAKKG
jgi:RNA exonuclease 4